MPDARATPADPIAEAERQWVAHGWDEAAAGMAVVTSLVRAHQLLVARVDRVLAPLDLTFARFEILRLLAFTRHGELPVGKMSARLQVHGTSVTSAVERLERQGFVERRRHPSDGRGVLVSITEAGRSVVEAATPRLNAEVFEELGLSPTQLAQLRRSLHALRRVAGDV